MTRQLNINISGVNSAAETTVQIASKTTHDLPAIIESVPTLPVVQKNPLNT
jgi:hypothetical protein